MGLPWTRLRAVIVPCLLIGMTVFVYWLTLGYGFVSIDDTTYLTAQPRLWDGLTLDNLQWAFTTRFFSNWHPLTWLSYMLDMQLFGLDNPGGFHLTNLVLHTLNVLLLFSAFRRMTDDFWKSAFVAAVFAVHPLCVESVAWVSERKDVLSTFFGLLAIIAYTDYVQQNRKLWYWAAWAAFACSLMSKQTLVTLPFVLLLLDYWPLRRLTPSAPAASGDGLPTPPENAGTDDLRGRSLTSWKATGRLVIEKWPFFLLTIAGCMIAVVAQQQGGSVVSIETVTPGQRILNIVAVYGIYLWHAVWPSGLVVFYQFPPDGVPIREVACSALLLAAVTAAAVWQKRRRPYLAVGWLWYLGTLVPMIGVVQVGSQRMADRYMYVPGIGLAIIAAWLAPSLLPNRPWRRFVVPAAAISVVLVFALVARRQTTYWENGPVLLERAITVDPSNSIAHYRLGLALAHERRDDEAIKRYREAVRLNTEFYRAHDSLGCALMRRGDADEAIHHFKEALRIAPTYALSHYNLGVILFQNDRREEAFHHFRESQRLDPFDFEIQRNIAMIEDFARQQRRDAGGSEGSASTEGPTK
mgnify:CR=1 FL=1